MQKKSSDQNGNLSGDSFFDKEPIFLYDFNSLQILDVNVKAVERYGYAKDELINMKISDLGDKIGLSDLYIKLAEESDIHPKELWRHYDKSGKSWIVQFTTQKFRLNCKPVRLAIAHNVNDLVSQEPLDIRKLPRIDMMSKKMPFAIVEWNRNFEIRDYSEKSELLTDPFFQDAIGKSLDQFPFIEEKTADDFRTSVQDGVTGKNRYFSMETIFKSDLGKPVVYQWHNSIVKNEEGEVIGIYSLIEDITDQRTATQELRKSESKFRVISEQSFVGIYILDGLSFSYVNPRMCEITGFGEKELKKRLSVVNLIHPDDFDRINAARKQWERENRESFEVSLRIISETGKILHVKTYGSAILSDGKQKILGVAIDQTEQLTAIENYKSSVQSYQSLFDSITDSIYIQDHKGRLLEVNQGVVEMYGYKKEEIIGKDPSFLSDLSKVDLKDAVRRFKLAKEGEPQEFRWWGKRKNGDSFPKEVKLTKGRFFGKDVVIAVARDISESVRREEKLRRNEELFEQLFSNSPLGVALLDRKSLIVQVNHSFESLFGYKINEIKGQNIIDLIVPEHDKKHANELTDGTEKFTLTKKRKTKGGELIDVFISGVPVILNDQPIALFGIYMDITDRIEAEERLRQSLEEKKVLLAEIHHRVKNNLAVITGLLELQYHNLESEEAKSALRDSQLRVNSMGLIHEKLYQSESLAEIDFGQYIRELVGVIVKSHNKSEDDIDIVMNSVAIKLPIKKAIPCGLVINEIVTNSMKYAFPDGHPNPEVIITMKLQKGRASIEISDNGIGLPAPFEEIGKKSLGTILIKTLTSQLHADLKVKSDGGTKYIFSFDLLGD